jgi:hypothetical protein
LDKVSNSLRARNSSNSELVEALCESDVRAIRAEVGRRAGSVSVDHPGERGISGWAR